MLGGLGEGHLDTVVDEPEPAQDADLRRSECRVPVIDLVRRRDPGVQSGIQGHTNSLLIDP